MLKNSGFRILRGECFRRHLAETQTAANDQQNAQTGPKQNSPFAHDGERHADSRAERERIGHKLRSGFVNSDEKRNQFENDENHAVDRFEQKSGQKIRRCVHYGSQYEPDFKNADGVKSRFEQNERQKFARLVAVKTVNQIFKTLDFSPPVMQNARGYSFSVKPFGEPARKTPFLNYHKKAADGQRRNDGDNRVTDCRDVSRRMKHQQKRDAAAND